MAIGRRATNRRLLSDRARIDRHRIAPPRIAPPRTDMAEMTDRMAIGRAAMALPRAIGRVRTARH